METKIDRRSTSSLDFGEETGKPTLSPNFFPSSPLTCSRKNDKTYQHRRLSLLETKLAGVRVDSKEQGEGLKAES